MGTTLEQLEAQVRSMNANDAFTKLGLDPDKPQTLEPLVEVVEGHELGATVRAVLIQVRGALQVQGTTLNVALQDPSFAEKLRQTVPTSSSISRAIPLAAVMNEHLGTGPFTIYDLGAGRAHASRMFIHPELLERPFFPNARMAFPKAQMPDVRRVVTVDSTWPSVEAATQVYYGANGEKTDKVRIMEEIEEATDADVKTGRFVRFVEDIRTVDSKCLLNKSVPGSTNVIFLNNVLYAVNKQTGGEICDAVNVLAGTLDAQTLQMEGWEVFYDVKPVVTLPGQDKPLGMPAFVRMGQHPGKDYPYMQFVAELDGSTGKPFILHTSDSRRVFVNKQGEQVEME